MRANERASGPVLQAVFLAVLDHNAVVVVVIVVVTVVANTNADIMG